MDVDSFKVWGVTYQAYINNDAQLLKLDSLKGKAGAVYALRSGLCCGLLNSNCTHPALSLLFCMIYSHCKLAWI